MNFDVPILFITYKRFRTAIRVFNQVKIIKPSKLYFVSNQAKTKQDIKHVKKVRFYGIPTEIDSIKPKFKTEPINDTNINNVITPMNNLEKLSENSVDF